MTTPATPTTPAQWEEYLNSLNTPAKFEQAFKDKSFQNNLKAYTNAQHTDLKAVAAEQAQIVMAEMLEGGAKNIRVARGRDNSAVHNKQAPGAGLDGKFATPADFFQNALTNPNNLSSERRQKFEELRNYSSQTGEGGGFLIPEEWRADIFGGPELAQAVVRPRATVIPVSGGGKLHYPAVEFSTEVGEIWGGMIFYWMDEQGTIPDTSAAFASVEFDSWTLAGAAKVPNSTLMDAPALEAWLRSSLPRGIREFEDRAFIKGDGVKKPLGGLHASNPSLIVVGDETGQSTASITWMNVLAMAGRLLPESWDNAVWVITPDAFQEIWTMALPVGTGGSAVMIAPGAGTATPTMTLLGRPIVWSRKAPAALGTQGDISLVDWSMYGVADRQDVRLDTSEHAFFFQNQTAFKVLERVDGEPLLLSPLTPENNGPTLSAFIQLETRSTD